MIIGTHLSIAQKLEILSDAAKYDVACTSSGVDRRGNGASMGNAVKAGICHAFSADGRCVSLLKILMTNECCYRCRYCVNRADNNVVRATFTPEEVAALTMEFYRRNYIEGLFLSSGIYPDPETTALRMLEALRLLRGRHRFQGYIHVKSIPGASLEVTQDIGWLADRMSVNLELPTADALRRLAPNKTRKTILKPMRLIQQGIAADRKRVPSARDGLPDYGRFSDAYPRYLLHAADRPAAPALKSGLTEGGLMESGLTEGGPTEGEADVRQTAGSLLHRPAFSMQRFVPAGQSTQMIIGAAGESDYEIMSVTQSLYRNFALKRVFYSAFINVNGDETLPAWDRRVLLDREHRLYQADFLLRFYGFAADDLLSAGRPNFHPLLDPKCDYALRHLQLFPMEINRAPYRELLKIPGIGVRSAQRIVAARRGGTLDFADLKKMGVVLKRAAYFITCRGRMLVRVVWKEDALFERLTEGNARLPAHPEGYRQMTFSDFGWSI